MAGLFSQNEGGELRQFSKDALTIFAFSYLAGWMDLCFSSYFTALDMPERSLLMARHVENYDMPGDGESLCY